MENYKTISVISKYLLTALFSIILLCSCGDSTDKDKCLESVKKEFPKSKIFTNQDGSNYYFYILDSLDNLYKVKTGSTFSTNVTEVTLMKRQQ